MYFVLVSVKIGSLVLCYSFTPCMYMPERERGLFARPGAVRDRKGCHGDTYIIRTHTL